MRSLLTLGASLALACMLVSAVSSSLVGCGSSSSGGIAAKDGGKDGTTELDASEDTTPESEPDAATDAPPSCRMGLCPKATPTCCENGNSPNFGFCYNMTNTAFCANEAGP